MPIIVTPIAPQIQGQLPSLDGVVKAGVPTVGDCPVLTRVRAFLVDQGVAATLEHTFTNRAGNPVDLTSLFPDGGSFSDSASASGKIKLRVKEALGRGASSVRNPVWEIDGECAVAASGTVRATLSDDVVARAGVYSISWGVENADGKLLLVNAGVLSVERTLFASVYELEKDSGPLTVQAIRGYLRDSHPNENLRLDDVEFSDDEILQALLRPVEYYNEQPPPLRPHCTTRDFPSRYNWSQATISVLYEMAANWYRRNKQQINAGGLADDDLNRDQAYDAKAQALWKEFKDWVINDKVMRNARLFAGQVGSIYGSGSGYRW